MKSPARSLNEILADFDLKDDRVLKDLADLLDVRVGTLVQRLKPSVKSPATFLERAMNRVEEILDEVRTNVRAINSRFRSANFGLYYPDFPSIEIDRLYLEPKMLPDRAGGPNDQRGVEWKSWLGELVQRIETLYQGRESPGGGLLKGGDSQRGKTIVMGSPGSGKTTILKKILLFLQETGQSREMPAGAHGQGRFTVLFLPLAVYNDFEPTDLFEAVKNYYVDVMALESKVSFEKFLARERELGRLVLLLDSFEEANVDSRQKIINHVNLLGCTVPVVLTSRYVSPRIDGVFGGAIHTYHLGGLSSRQIHQHLQLLIDATEAQQKQGAERGELIERLEKIKGHLQSLDRLANQVVSFRSEMSTPGARLYKDEKEYKTRKSRNAKEALAILSTPIYLNLCIVDFVRREISSSISIDHLISSYLDFLIRDWKRSRSDHKTTKGDPADAADLERVLGYAAFIFTTREHFGLDRLSEADLRSDLEEFFEQEIDQKSSTREMIRKLVRQLIENAETAQIFSSGNGKSQGLRFNAPHEIFTDFYLSRFVKFSAGLPTPPTSTYRRYAKPAVPSPPLRLSNYWCFLENPNLRFFENAMVMHMHSLVGDYAANPSHINMMLEAALYTPPIDPDLFPSIKEKEDPVSEINKIIPMNWIFLGRVFSRSTLQRNYKNVFEAVQSRLLEHLYDRTNFEFLYQKIYPIRRSFDVNDYSNQDELPLRASGRRDFETLDREWRRTTDCSRLLAIARCAENGFDPWDDKDNVGLKNMLCRRVAYQLRYSARTFNDDAFEWAKSYVEKRDSESHKALVVGTLRMVSDGLQHGNLQERIDAWVEEQTREDRGRWGEIYPRLYNALAPSRGSLRRIIEDPQFDFSILKNNQATIANMLNARREVFPEYVEIAFDYLSRPEADGQDPEYTKIVGKTLLFVCAIANSFGGQQLFMPRQYTLREIGGHVPDNLNYDPVVVLDALFRGALKGTDSVEDMGSLSRDNSDAASLGGWQLYDFYVQAIWYIMRYVPSFARYDYQN